MAGVANDLALFGHHGMAALGAGVKELFGFIQVGTLIHFFPNFKKRGQRSDDRLFVGCFVVHNSSLTWLFNVLNVVICPLIKEEGRFKLTPRTCSFCLVWGVDKR